METNTVWVLDDNPMFISFYQAQLGRDYEVIPFSNLDNLVQTLRRGAPSPQLLITEMILPDGNILDVLKNESLKRMFNFPIMVVTEVDDTSLLRHSYREGAEEVLIKPVAACELTIKVERLMRRDHNLFQKWSMLQEMVQRIDINELTQKESLIVCLFVKSKNRIVSRDAIRESIWGDTAVQSKTVDVHIHNLRKKILRYGLKIESIGNGEWQLVEGALSLSN